MVEGTLGGTADIPGTPEGGIWGMPSPVGGTPMPADTPVAPGPPTFSSVLAGLFLSLAPPPNLSGFM